MIERAVTFGRSHTLVGIVNEPGGNKGAETLPAMILVNAGLLNRSGPHRLYVTLARTLAERGFLSLRFDHSGLGDSDTRPDHLTYAAGVVSDTRLAMDYLEETYGVESFVLGGLCSGADHSFLTACADDRVAGAVLLDWYAYRTPGYYLRHYGPRILRLGPWIRKVARAVGSIRVSPQERGPRQVDPYARDIPSAKDTALALQGLVDRGSRFLCVYTGGQDALLNHAGQFFRMFPKLRDRGAIRAEYLPEAEHTFPQVENRKELVKLVVEWADTLREAVLSGEQLPNAAASD